MILGVAVSALMMALALRNVRLAEVAGALSGVRAGWIPVMVAVILGDLAIRAARWKLLLAAAAPRAGAWHLARLEAVGLAVNNVVFLRLGELARGFLAGRELGVPVVTALASIVVERALDMTALLFLFGASALAQGDVVPAGAGRTALWGAAGLAALLAAMPSSERFLPSGGDHRALRHRLLDLLRQAARGTRALRSPRAAGAAAVLSLALWLLDAGLYWAAGQAMGLGPLDYGRSVLVLSSAAAASFLPAVPGSFGTFEAAVQAFLVHLGVDGAAALGYAGFVHGVNYLVVTFLGIACLYREGYTLAGLKELRHAWPAA